MLPIKRSETVRAGTLLIVIVLICASVNVLFAITRIRSYSGPATYGVLPKQYIGEEASRRGWVIDPPDGAEWPPPDRWIGWRRFGFREFHVYGRELEQEVDLRLQRLGWPLAVLELRLFGSGSTGTGLQTREWTQRPKILPLGVLMNPLLVGFPLWVMLFGTPLAWKVVVRARRTGESRCPWCGYEGGGSGACPECGPIATN